MPGFRYHPAVIAHAAATLGAMYPGRFWLGLGAGEALNEHVIGGEWPEVGIRSAMMFEAIEVIDKLFSGKVVKHDGDYFTLESAASTRARRSRFRSTSPPPGRSTRSARPIRRRDHHRRRADEKIAMLWDKFREGAREVGKDPECDADPAPDPRQLGADRRSRPTERR